MANQILHLGPPPLTEEAADSAVDLIDFIAAEVRGVDLIDVTPLVRSYWRQHLVSWYPHLPPIIRSWYASAPFLLATVRAQWPAFPPFQQQAVLQQWRAGLPQMLWMLEPVLAEAASREHLQQQLQKQALLGVALRNLAEARNQMLRSLGDKFPDHPAEGPSAHEGRQASSTRSTAPVMHAPLNSPSRSYRPQNLSYQTQNLINFSNTMHNSTIGLIAARSGQSVRRLR
jgi:hypothetical protein